MATINQKELLAPEELSSGIAMHWIGGQWLDSGEHRESINPATGEVIGSYAKGGRKEAELAVSTALRAFRETDWKDNRVNGAVAGRGRLLAGSAVSRPLTYR